MTENSATPIEFFSAENSETWMGKCQTFSHPGGTLFYLDLYGVDDDVIIVIC
jgi:hypothetical protein